MLHEFIVFIMNLYGILFFFFFQAEDGIRDGTVTGVQTCALPILAPAARAADDSVPSLTASARAECDAGRRATDREARKQHFDRGQALAERAVALDDNSADAHFALFCNLGELMRLDGENLSQIFQLRRLMAEVDRTLELNPNHVDAMAAKGTLLVRLPRLLGGDSARGEAMLREVLARDPNAFTTRLALANVCEARGDRQEALIFATREATLAALPAAALDVLVIGGGITGAGVARDAALRGLRVALVDRLDWAAGTSSRSSKLIH